MKKLLSLMLVVLMLFACISCERSESSSSEESSQSSSAEQSESDSEEQSSSDSSDEEQQSSCESSSDSEESSSDDSSVSQPDEDALVYEAKTSEDKKTLYYLNYEMSSPVFTSYYHNYQAALSFTFDDGYDYNTGYYVNEIFAKYGFHGTAMLGPCFLNSSTVSQWNTILSKGYLDVGCHGYDHLEPTTLDSSGYEKEIKTAIEWLRASFPTQNVLTFATPYAHINDSYEAYLKDFCISNRLEAGGKLVKLGEEYNPYRIYSYSFNKNTASSINSSIKSSLDKGYWTVELVHCVLDEAYNSTDVSKSDFAEHCSYLYSNYKDKVWFASFEEVSIYSEQLKNAEVEYVSADRESITLRINCSLDSEIYNIPMSLEVYLPSFVDSAYAVIDGVEQNLKVEKHLGFNEKKTTVLDVPVDGTPVVIYIGGNNFYENGCAHDYSIQTIYDSTCAARGYRERECEFCGHSYKYMYGSIKEHVFEGERETVVIPTLEQNGLDRIACLNCDAKKDVITSYENIASESSISASEDYNQWVSTSSLVDNSDSTFWMSKIENGSIELTFTESEVKNIEILVANFVEQQITVSVKENGEWNELSVWQSTELTSEPTKISLELEKSITGVKIYFDKTSAGCSSIYEIYIYAIKEL